jgi:hypothetical protein
MVETISPVGYGGRTRRWLAAVALHVLGATATAAAFGGALGAVGALLHAPWGIAGVVAIAALALAYAAREAFGLPLPVPAARRQVPDWWRSFFSWPVAALLYGAGLGIGFLTYLTNGGLVVVAGAAVASGSPSAGALIVGAFGLARGLSALVAWPVRTHDDGTALVDRLAARDPVWWRRANAAALALVGGSALAVVPRVAAPAGVARTGLAAATAAILALAFGWSAAAKLAAPRRWRQTLAAYGLPDGLAAAAPAAVPALELTVAVAAALGLAPVAGALALLLLAAFSAAIVRMRIGGAHDVACGCFGGTRHRDYRALLGRNLLLATAAVVALRGPARPLTGWPGIPLAGEFLPFALAIGALVVAGLTAWRAAVWLGRGRRA